MTRFMIMGAVALLGQAIVTATVAAQTVQAAGSREGRDRTGIASTPMKRIDMRIENRIDVRLDSRLDRRVGSMTGPSQLDQATTRLRLATGMRRPTP